MRIILHIGLYKTGTTAVQKFFTRNRAALARRGVLYPESYTKFDAHHPLPWALGVGHRDKDSSMPAEEVVRAILHEADAAGAETVILSSEEFINLEAAERLAKLKRLFDPHAIEVLIYLRRQDSLLLSSYGQHVRMYSIRFSGTISDFLLKHSNFLNKYNYWQMLQRWANVFGSEAMRIKLYDQAKFPQGNIVEDFADTLGLDLDGCDVRKVSGINRNLSDLGLEVLRRLNAIPLDEATHHRLIRCLDESPLQGQDDYQLLSRRNRRELMGQFANSNARVARHWLGCDDGVLFESREPSDGTEPAPGYERPNEDLVVGALVECLVRSVRGSPDKPDRPRRGS
jgi:hypothetical protein